MKDNVFSWTKIEERHMDIWTSLVLWNQWWDEWKWKITDILAQTSDVIVRFNWWHNAWHTVKVWNQEFDLHILPSWMVSEWKINLITSSCVLWIELNKIDLDKIEIRDKVCICNYNLDELLKRKNWKIIRVWLIPELEKLEIWGINIAKSWLKISGETTVIWIHNVLLDALDEKQREAVWLSPIGSTWSGISRAYASQDMRYHFTLSDLIYRKELFYQSVEALFSTYKNIFPKIKISQLINKSKIERDKIIKYIQNWTIEIINDEAQFIDKLNSKWKKIVGEWAQSAMIGSWNSIYWTASEPSLQSFLNVSWLSEQKVWNIFLVHKMPPSSVWIRPWYLKFPESEELKIFRNKYSERWVSTWRDRDLFNYSLPETAKWSTLNTKWLSDDSRIVPVYNRIDWITDWISIDPTKNLRIVTWFSYTIDSILKWWKSNIEVWVLWFENINPKNLLKHYPQKANQVDLFTVKPSDLRIVDVKWRTINEKINNLLWLHMAAVCSSDIEREYLIWTWPSRDDLEVKIAKPIRTI